MTKPVFTDITELQSTELVDTWIHLLMTTAPRENLPKISQVIQAFQSKATPTLLSDAENLMYLDGNRERVSEELRRERPCLQ